MHQSSRRLLSALACVLAVLICAPPQMSAYEPPSTVALQELIDDLKTELGVDVAVSAELVTTNSLLVSVEPVDGAPGKFRMAFEEGFLPSLEQDELRAIVAHELGHVWIFTHHPYLQTERLANTVAMRAVPRASLERVYNKVWEHQGTKGDLTRFLGPE
jgi:hypothetical protein